MKVLFEFLVNKDDFDDIMNKISVHAIIPIPIGSIHYLK